MFKKKIILFYVVLCFALITSVGFAAWTISDAFDKSLNGNINAEDAMKLEFVTIAEPSKFIRFTDDGFMYYYNDNDEKEYYNVIEFDVTVDINKWFEKFGDSAKQIYVELTLETVVDGNDYNVFSDSNKFKGEIYLKGTTSNLDKSTSNNQLNVVGTSIDVYKTENGVNTVNSNPTFTIRYEFSQTLDNPDSTLPSAQNPILDIFNDKDSIFNQGTDNIFNINATVSVDSESRE